MAKKDPQKPNALSLKLQLTVTENREMGYKRPGTDGEVDGVFRADIASSSTWYGNDQIAYEVGDKG